MRPHTEKGPSIGCHLGPPLIIPLKNHLTCLPCVKEREGFNCLVNSETLGNDGVQRDRVFEQEFDRIVIGSNGKNRITPNCKVFLKNIAKIDCQI